MRWTAWILAVVTVVVGVVAVGGLLVPRTVSHERTVVVEARRPTVFAVLNGLAHSARWWPWSEPAGASTVSYDGPPFGPGASLRWTAVNPAGRSGSHHIVASAPFTQVAARLELEGIGPADSSFRLDEVESGTRLSWTVTLDLGYDLVGRYAAFFAQADPLGAEIERGLGALKALCEGLPQADWTQLDVTVTEAAALPILSLRVRAAADQGALWGSLAGAFATVATRMAAAGVAPTGAPVATALAWGDDGMVFEAGYPCGGEVDRARVAAAGLTLTTLPGGRVVEAVHAGDYAGIPLTYQRLAAFLAAHGFTPAGAPRESYFSNPAAAGADRLTTVITYPVQAPLAAGADPETASR